MTEQERKAEFDRVYRDHEAGLRSWVKWRLHDNNDVDDVMQDTWLKVWEKMLSGVRMDPVKIGRCSRDSFSEFFRRRGGGQDPLEQEFKKSIGNRDLLQMTGNKDFLRNLTGYWAERIVQGDATLRDTCRELFGEGDNGTPDASGYEWDDPTYDSEPEEWERLEVDSE